jgi:hypothetical protein
LTALYLSSYDDWEAVKVMPKETKKKPVKQEQTEVRYATKSEATTAVARAQKRFSTVLKKLAEYDSK